MKKQIHLEPKQKRENRTDISVRYTENGERIITVNENGKITEMINPRVLAINDLRGTLMIGWEDKSSHIQVRQFKGSRAEMLRKMMFGRSNAESENGSDVEVMLTGTVQPLGA